MSKKVPKRNEFFIYRTNPFRPLYMSGVGFRAPPSQMEQSLAREGFHLWLFRVRDTARLMASGNKAEYAPIADFARLWHGRPPVTKPTTAVHRKRPPTLEELA